MSAAAFWVMLIPAAIATFLLRWSFIALSGVLNLPGPIQRALQYVPPAVLAAIVLPQVLVQDGHVQLTLDNPRLIAALLAFVVAWRSHNIFYTLVIGMGALWGLTAVQGWL